MSAGFDGVAIVYCDGLFDNPCGKTAHGLVRFTERYRVVAVIDAHMAGRDAGEALDGRHRDIPLVATLDEALRVADVHGGATHLVIGVAPDGGRLPPAARDVVAAALEAGLHVDSGLHDFLGDDPRLAALAEQRGRTIRDVRRTPERDALHHFSGAIEGVDATVVALLGTDSAIGKRTTSWMLVHAWRARGGTAEMIGTGQTAWMQGARYGFVLDSCINDFVSGEIEHAVVTADRDARPDLIVLEGQGSLMNPAYPGGLELLAAGRPHAIVLQHAPGRLEYDGFPGYPIQPVADQIRALELVGGRPVVAITVNHEGLAEDAIDAACARLTLETGLPCCDPVVHGIQPILAAIEAVVDARRRARG